MTIEIPACLGLIVRKSERSDVFLVREKARLLAIYQRSDPSFSLVDFEKSLPQDEYLLGLSVAMNASGLLSKIVEIEQTGCVRGVDFVVTGAAEGVIDKPVPTWLSVESRPSVFHPDALAKLDLPMRRMFEKQICSPKFFCSFVVEA